jgi:hypothetical protein
MFQRLDDPAVVVSHRSNSRNIEQETDLSVDSGSLVILVPRSKGCCTYRRATRHIKAAFAETAHRQLIVLPPSAEQN